MWLPKNRVVRHFVLAACFFAIIAAGILCATPLSVSTGHCAANDAFAVWCGSVETHRAIASGAILDIFALALLAVAACLGGVFFRRGIGDPLFSVACSLRMVRLRELRTPSYLQVLFARGILHPRCP